MSVINDMLRDLDRRNASAPMLPLGTLTLEPHTPQWRAPVLGLCVLLAGYALWATYFRQVAVSVVVQSAAMQSTREPFTDGQLAPSKLSVLAPEIFELPPLHFFEPTLIIESPTVAIDSEMHDVNPSPIDNTTRTTKTLGTTAEQHYRTALALFDRGQRAAAEAELTDALLLQPQWPPALAALATSYLASQRAAQAQLLLEPAVAAQSTNTELRLLLARALLAQNHIEQAYVLLSANPPPLNAARDYHAVLAAIEQQLKHYAAAAARYRALLETNSEQASWWLGLGIALEGDQQRSDAHNAYRRALALNTLPDAARQYATERARLLGSD